MILAVYYDFGVYVALWLEGLIGPRGSPSSREGLTMAFALWLQAVKQDLQTSNDVRRGVEAAVRFFALSSLALYSAPSVYHPGSGTQSTNNCPSHFFVSSIANIWPI